MTTPTKSRGFTIVELLIVIVVIAILAAITIVAYNGITRNANASSAKSNADALRSFVSAYQSDDALDGTYPATPTSASTQYAKLPAGLTVGATLPDGTNGKTTLAYLRTSNNQGACIGYWNYAATSPAVEWIKVGNASNTAPTTSGSPAAITTCAS